MESYKRWMVNMKNKFLIISKILKENLLLHRFSSFIHKKIKNSNLSPTTKNLLLHPLTWGTSFFILSFILYYWFSLLSSKVFSKITKIDKQLSLKIRQLVPTKQWKVRIVGRDPDQTMNDYNAFTFTIDDNIYMTEDMYNNFSMDEKVAICLHEVNHRLGYHSLYSIADNSLSISLLSTIVCFSGDSIPINSDKTKNRNTVLLILCLCFLNEFVLSHWISRQLEWKSDDYAIKLGYGKHLASGFERIVKYYEAEKQKPLKWYQKIMTWTDEFLSDHPDIHERIKNALEKSSNVSKNKDQFIINSINNLKSQEEEIESYDTVAKS